MRIHFSEYKIPYVCSRIPNTFLATSRAMKGNIQMMFCSCSCIVIMNILYGGKHVHKQFRSTIGAGNSLVPDDTKPLPDPMLTQSSDATWHHKAKMS